MRIGKRGTENMLPSETGGVILAVFGTLVLISLLVALYWAATSFDQNKATAENYLKNFKDALNSAERGYPTNFSLWVPEDNKEAHFYLVYFGEKSSFNVKNVGSFVHLGKHENLICVCYTLKESVTCKQCMELKQPGDYSGGSPPWFVSQGQRIEISKGEGVYVFKKF